MGFVTKIDYSDNRQIKQFQLTNTSLSGATTFGANYDELDGGVDESTVTAIGVYTGVTSTFSGNSITTEFHFDEPIMDSGSDLLPVITNTTSGETYQTLGYVGNDSIEVDGNIVFTNYTGVTYDFTVTSIEQVDNFIWTGTSYSENVVVLSGGSKDFSSRTIWVDVKGITRTKKLILLDEPEIDNSLTTVLARDNEGEIKNIELNFLAGSGDDFVTGTTFNPSSGDLTFNRLSGATFSVNLDNRYTVSGHTHTVNDISDIQTWLSAKNLAYTNFTNFFTNDQVINGLVVGRGNNAVQGNIVLGQNSLKQTNLTGSKNLAIGDNVLSDNTTGHDNVGIGDNVLKTNVSGYQNVLIGSGAGNFSGFTNTSMSSSTIIGYNSRPLNINETNQIIIGSEVIGNGSNTVTIGNNSITDNYFSGNLNVSGAATVNGSIKSLNYNLNDKWKLELGATKDNFHLYDADYNPSLPWVDRRHFIFGVEPDGTKHFNTFYGFGTDSPGEKLHLADGNFLFEGAAEVGMIFKLANTIDGELPSSPGTFHTSAPFVNPIFKIGRIIKGGDGAPQFRWMYQDDSRGEHVVMELDSEGIMSSVRQAGLQSRGSHFEGHAEGDAQPYFRLNSYPYMRLEMGNGGGDVTDVAIGRSDVGTLSFLIGVGAGTEVGKFTSSGLEISNTLIVNSLIQTNEIRNRTGQELVLNVGESHLYTTGQTNEVLYVNAENGLEVSFSPDNWTSGWVGRETFVVNSTQFTYKGFDVIHQDNLKADLDVNNVAYTNSPNIFTVNQTVQGDIISTRSLSDELIVGGVTHTGTSKTSLYGNTSISTGYFWVNGGTSYLAGNTIIGASAEPTATLDVRGSSELVGNTNITGTLGVTSNVGIGGDVTISNSWLWLENSWGYSDDRWGVGVVPYGPNRIGDNILQVDGAMDITGSIGWKNPDMSSNWRIFPSATNELLIMKNYEHKTVVLDIRGDNQDVLVDNGEATLALVRSNGDESNSEFLDLYNNGYHSSNSVRFGIRLQKRGTGQYRPFDFEYGDGTTEDRIFRISPDGNKSMTVDKALYAVTSLAVGKDNIGVNTFEVEGDSLINGNLEVTGNTISNKFIGDGPEITKSIPFESQNIDTYARNANWSMRRSISGVGDFPAGYVIINNLAGDGTNRGVQLASSYGSDSEKSGYYIRRASDNPSATNGVGWQTWQSLATQNWVSDNFSELVGDNVAYTNVNNNFSTNQTINTGFSDERKGLRVNQQLFNSNQASGVGVISTNPISNDFVNSYTFTTGGSSGNIFANSSFGIRHTFGGVASTFAEVNTDFMVTSTATGVPYSAIRIMGQTGRVGLNNLNPTEILDVVGVIKAQSPSSIQAKIDIDNTSTFGRKYSLISSGGSSGINGGKFAIYDNTDSAYRYVIDTNGHHDFKSGNITTLGTINTSDFILSNTLGQTHYNHTGAGFHSFRVQNAEIFRIQGNQLGFYKNLTAVSGVNLSLLGGNINANGTITSETGRLISKASQATIPIIQILDTTNNISWNLENGRNAIGELNFRVTTGGDVMSLSNTGNLNVTGSGSFDYVTVTNTSNTAAPLVLQRDSQVGIHFDIASLGDRYLGVSTDGNLRYGNSLNHGINDIVATQDWVQDNFSELVGDNVAYTNVDNNFSTEQTFKSNIIFNTPIGVGEIKTFYAGGNIFFNDVNVKIGQSESFTHISRTGDVTIKGTLKFFPTSGSTTRNAITVLDNNIIHYTNSGNNIQIWGEGYTPFITVGTRIDFEADVVSDSNVTANSFIGDGSQITNISQTNLPSNVAFTNANNNFSVNQTVNAGLTVTNWLSASSYIDVTGLIYHRNNISVRNKDDNGWVTWATKNTNSVETVINLSNIGSIGANAVNALFLTDGHITWSSAQFNRTGGRIEFQWNGGSNQGVRFFGNTGYDAQFDGLTGNLNMKGSISADGSGTFGGDVTANSFRTTTTTDDYSFIYRDGGINNGQYSLYVQNSNESVAKFISGSNVAGSGGTTLLDVTSNKVSVGTALEVLGDFQVINNLPITARLYRTSASNVNLQVRNSVNTMYLGMGSTTKLRWGSNTDANANDNIATEEWVDSEFIRFTQYDNAQDANTIDRTEITAINTNNTTPNRNVNYSTIYTLGGGFNALQLGTNEDYSDSGLWIRQYNINASSPNGAGWQNWKELATQDWVNTQVATVDTLQEVTENGRLTSTIGSAVWDEVVQGTADGNIVIDTISDNESGGAITWRASDSTGSQAGIYVKSDGAYGTKMYLSTTNIYATGAVTSLSIDHQGNVGVERGDLDVKGDVKFANNSGILYAVNTNDAVLKANDILYLQSGGSNFAARFDASANTKLYGNLTVDLNTTVDGLITANASSGFSAMFNRGFTDNATNGFSHYFTAGNAHVLGRSITFEGSVSFAPSTNHTTTDYWRINNYNGVFSLTRTNAGVSQSTPLTLSGDNATFIGTVSGVDATANNHFVTRGQLSDLSSYLPSNVAFKDANNVFTLFNSFTDSIGVNGEVQISGTNTATLSTLSDGLTFDLNSTIRGFLFKNNDGNLLTIDGDGNSYFKGKLGVNTSAVSDEALYVAGNARIDNDLNISVGDIIINSTAYDKFQIIGVNTTPSEGTYLRHLGREMHLGVWDNASHEAGFVISNPNNNIVDGYISARVADTEHWRTLASGNTGFGTTNPLRTIDAHGAVRSTRNSYTSQYIEIETGESIDSRLTASSNSGNQKGLSIRNVLDTGTTVGVNNYIRLVNGTGTGITRYELDYLGNHDFKSGSLLSTASIQGGSLTSKGSNSGIWLYDRTSTEDSFRWTSSLGTMTLTYRDANPFSDSSVYNINGVSKAVNFIGTVSGADATSNNHFVTLQQLNTQVATVDTLQEVTENGNSTNTPLISTYSSTNNATFAFDELLNSGLGVNNGILKLGTNLDNRYFEFNTVSSYQILNAVGNITNNLKIQSGGVTGIELFDTGNVVLGTNGDVGIGGNPNGKLNVFVDDTNGLRISRIADPTNQYLEITQDGTADWLRSYSVAKPFDIRTVNAQPLLFGTNNIQRYVIDSSGNHDFKSGNITTLGSGTFDDLLSKGSYPTIYLNHNGTVLGGLRSDALTKLELKTLTTAPIALQVNANNILTAKTTGVDIVGDLDVTGDVTATSYTGNFGVFSHSDFNDVKDTRFFKGINDGSLLNGAPDGNVFNTGISVMYSQGTNPSGWQIVSGRDSGNKLYYRQVSNNTYYGYKALATEDWVQDNFSELSGDNVAYTNVDNNFTSFQDFQGTIRSAGTLSPATGKGLELRYNTVNDYSSILSFDRDNGLYKPMEFVGSEFYFNVGNVGIGTSSPSEKLEVSGNILAKDSGVLAGVGGGKDGFVFHDLYTGSGDYYGYKAYTNNSNTRLSIVTNGAERLTTLVNGNVGIGTTSPLTKLGLSDNSSGAILSFKRNVATTSGSKGGLTWIDSSNYYVAGISAVGDGVTDNSGEIIFRTSTGAVDSTDLGYQLPERMRIDSVGKVGIGTSNPTTTLHTFGSAPGVGYLTVENSTHISKILLKSTTATASIVMDNVGGYIAGGGLIFDSGTNLRTQFLQGGLSKMIINDGNVAIGTTSPSTVGGTAKLTVDVGTGTASPISIINGTTDGMYIRRYNSGGSYQLQTTVGGGNSGNLSLQSYGGNVGVGTDSPRGLLEIGGYGNLGAVNNKVISTIIDGGFSTTNQTQYNVQAYIGTTIGDVNDIFTNTSSETFKNFYVGIISSNSYYNNSRYSIISNGLERLIVNASSGNVGLNTITPTEKLDVEGNIQAISYKINGATVLSGSATVQVGSGGTTGVINLNTVSGNALSINGLNSTFGGSLTVKNALIDYQENLDSDIGVEEVATISSLIYDAVFFDFVIKNGLNLRAGTIICTHDGTNIEYNEVSTQDLGDTSGITLSVDINGGNIRLLATTTSNDWKIKTLIRGL